MTSTEDLITWLRQIWDDQRTELEQLLAEYLGTHPEHGIRLQLDEVNAKLRILDEIEDQGQPLLGNLYDLLRVLAQPYAGKPGWREEWAA